MIAARSGRKESFGAGIIPAVRATLVREFPTKTGLFTLGSRRHLDF
jgi:hypothetical protein